LTLFECRDAVRAHLSPYIINTSHYWQRLVAGVCDVKTEGGHHASNEIGMGNFPISLRHLRVLERASRI
jgi:hypothetical protein